MLPRLPQGSSRQSPVCLSSHPRVSFSAYQHFSTLRLRLRLSALQFVSLTCDGRVVFGRDSCLARGFIRFDRRRRGLTTRQTTDGLVLSTETCVHWKRSVRRRKEPEPLVDRDSGLLPVTTGAVLSKCVYSLQARRTLS